MSNDIESKALVTYTAGGSEIKLSPKIVKDYITGGQEVSLAEFKMFAELCKVKKLNPFLKEAYIVKYSQNSPAVIVTGKDAILKRAILNTQFDGREQGIIVQKDNEIEYRNGTFKLSNEKLVGGWAKVYRKDWTHPTYITVAFDEVAQKKNDGTLNTSWATKSATMVEKVALVRALRETFAEDLGGMIDEDEAWQNKDLRTVETEIIPQQDIPHNEVTGEIETANIDDI